MAVLRSTYAAGPAGDAQYQDALKRNQPAQKQNNSQAFFAPAQFKQPEVKTITYNQNIPGQPFMGANSAGANAEVNAKRISQATGNPNDPQNAKFLAGNANIQEDGTFQDVNNYQNNYGKTVVAPRNPPTVATPDQPLISKGGNAPTFQASTQDPQKMLEDISYKKLNNQTLTEDENRFLIQQSLKGYQAPASPAQDLKSTTSTQSAGGYYRAPSNPDMPLKVPLPSQYKTEAEFSAANPEAYDMWATQNGYHYSNDGMNYYPNQPGTIPFTIDQFVNATPDEQLRMRQQAFLGMSKQQQDLLNSTFDQLIGANTDKYNAAKDQMTADNQTQIDQFTQNQNDAATSAEANINKQGAVETQNIKDISSFSGFGRSTKTMEILQNASEDTKARIADIERAKGQNISQFQASLVDKMQTRLDKILDTGDQLQISKAQKSLDLMTDLFKLDPSNPANIMDTIDKITKQKLDLAKASQDEKDQTMKSVKDLIDTAAKWGFTPDVSVLSASQKKALAENMGIKEDQLAGVIQNAVDKAKKEDSIKAIANPAGGIVFWKSDAQGGATIVGGIDDRGNPLNVSNNQNAAQTGTGNDGIVSAAKDYVSSGNWKEEFKAHPELQGGNLGCAWVASSILTKAGYLKTPLTSVDQVSSALENTGWGKTTTPQAGDVIVWDVSPDSAGHKHIGILTSNGTVIDNQGTTGPIERKIDGRKVLAMYSPPQPQSGGNQGNSQNNSNSSGQKNFNDYRNEGLSQNMTSKEAAAYAAKKVEEDTAKPTDAQGNAAIFAKRLEESEKIFDDLSSQGYNFSNSKYILQRAAPSDIFGISTGGYGKSDELKIQDQAERNFINAVLRRESGAAISPAEFASANEQYFPQPGDPPQKLKNKKQNRDTVIQGLKSIAGNAYTKAYGSNNSGAGNSSYYLPD